jgi:hypothetical protein
VVREAKIFVAVLGASSLTYAEATWSHLALARGEGRYGSSCANSPASTCSCSTIGDRSHDDLEGGPDRRAAVMS